MIVYILKGCGVTVSLSIVTMICSIPLGVIGAIGKISGVKILKSILNIYTWIFRGTPLLLQVFFVYYGIPIIFPALNMPAFAAAAITFSLNYGAYLTEVFRAGIESIDKGQYEASKALGFNYKQTMRHIILPQTVRRVIPPTCNESVNLIKDTALVAAISMGDLSRAASEIVTRDLVITPFIIAAGIYLIMTSVLMFGFRKLEDRYSIYQ